jgi:hypothetical protein
MLGLALTTSHGLNDSRSRPTVVVIDRKRRRKGVELINAIFEYIVIFTIAASTFGAWLWFHPSSLRLYTESQPQNESSRPTPRKSGHTIESKPLYGFDDRLTGYTRGSSSPRLSTGQYVIASTVTSKIKKNGIVAR